MGNKEMQSINNHYNNPNKDITDSLGEVLDQIISEFSVIRSTGEILTREFTDYYCTLLGSTGMPKELVDHFRSYEGENLVKFMHEVQRLRDRDSRLRFLHGINSLGENERQGYSMQLDPNSSSLAVRKSTFDQRMDFMLSLPAYSGVEKERLYDYIEIGEISDGDVRLLATIARLKKLDLKTFQDIHRRMSGEISGVILRKINSYENALSGNNRIDIFGDKDVERIVILNVAQDVKNYIHFLRGFAQYTSARDKRANDPSLETQTSWSMEEVQAIRTLIEETAGEEVLSNKVGRGDSSDTYDNLSGVNK